LESSLRLITYQNWITIIIVGCVILLAAIKFFYQARFSDFINVVGADRFFSTRSKGVFILHPLQIVLLVIQFTGISLLFYLAYCSITGLPYSENFDIFKYIFLGYSIFEIVKFLLERFIAYVLNFDKKMQSFFYKRLNVKHLLGLFALLGSAFIVYQLQIPFYFIYSILGIVITIYTISQFWLIRKYKSDFFRFPFYFILYFCTLEIGPYFILYSFITKQ
jgi:hypothetical protein